MMMMMMMMMVMMMMVMWSTAKIPELMSKTLKEALISSSPVVEEAWEVRNSGALEASMFKSAHD